MQFAHLGKLLLRFHRFSHGLIGSPQAVMSVRLCGIQFNRTPKRDHCVRVLLLLHEHRTHIHISKAYVAFFADCLPQQDQSFVQIHSLHRHVPQIRQGLRMLRIKD